MALPAAITKATVTWGAWLTIFGDEPTVSVTVSALLGGSAQHIVWHATGQSLADFDMTVDVVAGQSASFQVPHVDQPGFRDGGGNDFTNWSYRAVAKVSRPGQLDKTYTKIFQVVEGQTLVDLDTVPDGTVGVPGSSPVPAVTSVNGQTGAVTVGATPTDGRPGYAPASGLWVDPLSAFNLKSSNTARWRRGIGRVGRQDYAAGVQDYNELWIGDSILGGCTGLTAGPGATARFDRLNTIADFSARSIAAAAGQEVAGTGLVRWRDNSRPDARVTYSAGSPETSTSYNVGVGQWAQFQTNLPGTQVTVVYYDNFSNPTVGFKIAVNGATSGAGYREVVGTGTSTWKWTTLTLPIAVGDTIRVTGVTGNTYHAFVEVRDTAKHVQAHNLAASGSKVSGDWESVGNGFSKIRQFKDTIAAAYAFDVIHLVFPFFDVADAVPVGTFKTAMSAFITNLPPADVVLHAPPLPGMYRGAPAGAQATYLAYLTALYEIALDRDLPLFDANHLTGGYPIIQPIGLAGDDTAHYLQPVYAGWGRAAAKLTT